MKKEILAMSLNFLESSIDHLQKDGSSNADYQFSIIQLFASIELILKARLLEEHWTLIIENRDALNKEKFESGESKSIGSDEAINRLNNICGCNIKEKNIRKISGLRKKRNKIIHIGKSVNEFQALSDIVDAYSFIYDFSEDTKLFAADKKLEEKFLQIKRKISTLKEFKEKRSNHIKKDLKKHNYLSICPECKEKTIVFSEQKRTCLFCNAEFDKDDYESSVIEELVPYDFFENYLFECPECQEESAFCHEDHNDPICYSCGSNLENYLICSDCSELFHSDSTDSICSDCMKNRFENDQPMPAPLKWEDEH